MSVILLISTLGGIRLQAMAGNTNNYCEALATSLYFFDENACGMDVENLGISWRGNCHTYDSRAKISSAWNFPTQYQALIDPDGDGLVDVSGGYHDAGDHIKFNITMGFAGSSLAMAEYLHPGVYEKAGCKEHLIKILKRNADYLMKTTWLDTDGRVVGICHVVADGHTDHNVSWGAPEAQTYERRTYWLTKEANNSSECCEMAAALAGTAYVVRDKEPAYALECIKYAKALVAFATEHPGNETGGLADFYGTDPMYQDEHAVATAWLWILGEGNRPAYQPNGNGGYGAHYDCYMYCWDKVWQGYAVMMYKATGENVFADEIRFELKNKGGLSVGTYNMLGITWGVSRANAAFQMDALALANGDPESEYAKAAKYQMDYILGENTYGYSFLIGYGEKNPVHIHHRAANPNKNEATYVLKGALIGGPDQNGYADDADAYQYTEPALDYNGCFALACSGLAELYGTSAGTDDGSREEQQEQQDRDLVAAFVERMYKLCLNRQEDKEGAAYWTEKLKSGSESGASVAEQFVFSLEANTKELSDEQFVKLLYNCMMDREPENDGLTYWTGQLSSGQMTRYEVANGFISSPEFEGICVDYGITRGSLDTEAVVPIERFVTRMYRLSLERNAEQEGTYYWTFRLKDHMENGATFAEKVFFSDEMRSKNLSDEKYVELLYNAMMDRASDETGKAYWLNKMAEDNPECLSRREVLNGFIVSDEFTGICARYGIERGELLH